MKQISSIGSAILLISAMLAACGGGGGGSSSPAEKTSSATVATELEGTWIASTDGHPSGAVCGLTPSGAPGERFTVTFSMNRYTHKSESCLIVSGNQGAYINAHNASGTFFIGAISLQSNDPTMQMRALDLVSSSTSYTSYNLVANTLHIALPFQTFDGSTRDKRAFQINMFLDPVSRTWIDNPAYIKQ